jgi:hypothetical protein
MRTSLITLTLKSCSEPLPDQVDRLYRNFRALRQMPVWRKAKPRGFGVLEITYNAERKQWHPHLHLLADAPYIPHQALTAAWNQVTHGSFIVDIRRVCTKNIERVQKYLSEYLTKPPCDEVLNDNIRLAEWIETLENRKVLLRFGKPQLADEKPPEPQPEDWTLIGRYDAILSAANAGDAEAMKWIAYLHDFRQRETNDPKAGKDYRIDGIHAVFQ